MRTFFASLLALVACLVLPVAVVAAWLGTVVDDTDRYVETVGPLATDAQVVDALEQTLTDRTLSTVEQNLPLDAGSADLRPAIAAGVRTVVTNPEFRPAWEAANADAHRQLLAQLRGGGRDGDVVLDLGSVVDSVLREVSGSLPIQVSAPEVSVPVTVLQGDQVQQARSAYDVLDTARVWAPAAWLVLVALALLLSTRRGGTLALVGVTSAVTLGVTLLLLGFARDRVVGAVAAADRPLSGAVWDGVTASLDLLVLVGLGLAALLVVLGLAVSFASRRRA
ncbi:hypothetical protein [Nocardioides marmoraquaticus]